MPHLNSSIHPLEGFHPTLTTTIHFGDLPQPSECSLHLYYDLPSLVFFDPYELANYDDFFTFQKWGNSNLELPVTALDSTDGSQLLLNVKFDKLRLRENLDVKLPLHMRYGDPAQAKDGYHLVGLEEPRGILACPLDSKHTTRRKGLLPASDPRTYRTEVASTLLSQSQKTFFDIAPLPNSNQQHHELTLRVPVGTTSDLLFVELGTTITILSCFFYLLHVSWGVTKKLAVVKRLKGE
ncbi:hypothetical protein BDN72DRAFT_847946 [Pluteus cervinus]|uniref:Uncharacterized protein n=1 Tax=Pluteus cervinus TaxID=181527 RepID=A0ACD3AC39_9AGAR|nr:hypothetical protein BDN72DRAFT_847946 [Pluteus cervinus]